MKIVRNIGLVILFMGLWTIGYGQQSDSLTFYLELAAKNNPTVQQKFSEYQAALQKIPQVGSLPDPELSLGVFLSPMELIGGKQVADIRLMQMFPWFGVLKAAKDEMSLMAKARFESFRDAKFQVFFDLQQSWYELYKIQQATRISEKNLEILRTLERLSLVRFKSASPGGSSISPSVQPGNSSPSTSGSSGMQSMGGKPGSSSGKVPVSGSGSMQSSPMASGSSGLADIYRIQIEIGDLKNNIASLESRHNTVVARFNSFLNRPVQSPVSLPDTLIAGALNIPLMMVSDSMINNNPMLAMLKYEELSLDARKEMVTRMGYPMIGLGVNYSLINTSEMSASEMNGNDMIMPMVTVTLPFYRRKYKAMRAEADLQKTATMQGITAAENLLQSEYYAAVENYQDAQRRIALYTRQNQLANQSLNIMMKSFSASGAGLTDLLRVRQQILDYELKQVESLADFNIAIAQLNRLMAYSQIQ